MDGRGVYYYDDGSIWKGHSKNGAFEGRGRLICADFAYEGEYRNKSRTGFGI